MSATVWTLTAILILAAGLRLRGIGRQSLWHDETLSLESALVPFREVVRRVDNLENTPPGYFLLLNRWVRLAGHSEVALRLPSAIFSVAAVGAMFALAMRLLVSDPLRRPVALGAALLMALSRLQIAYAQEARAYSIMMLLALVSCYCFAVLLKARPWWARVVYVLSSAGILWTHPYGGFVLMAQGIFACGWLVWRMRDPRAGGEGWLGWIAMMVCVVALFEPWFEAARRVWGVGEPWMKPPTLRQSLLTYADTIHLLVGLLVLASIGLVWGVRRRQAAVIFAALVAVLPVAVPLVVSSVGRRPVFAPRYGMTMQIGLYLLAAHGAAALGRRLGTAALAIVCLLALPNLASDFAQGLNMQRKVAARDAAEYVAAHAAPGDGLLANELGLDRQMEVYWPRKDLVAVGSLSGGMSPPPPRVWLVFQEPSWTQTGLTPQQVLEQNLAGSAYREVSWHEVPGAVIVELRRAHEP